MVSIFWNREERRLRAFWRLVLHVLIIVVLFLISGTAYALLTGFGTDNVQGGAITPGVWELTAQGLIILLSVWLAGRFLDRRPFADFGFHLNRRWWADLAFGLVLGAVLMAIVFVVELAAGWVEVTQWLEKPTEQSPFLLGLLGQFYTFLLVGIYEEVFSRGYHLRNIAEGLNLPWIGPRAALLSGYLLSSLFFGLLHAANPNASLISTFNIILAGLFLGLGVVLTGELAIAIGLHITWNFFQGNIFGFPVSGTGHQYSLLGIRQGGPELWTGGAFGPEAGLVGLITLLIGSILIVLWVRNVYGKARLNLDIPEYPFITR